MDKDAKDDSDEITYELLNKALENTLGERGMGKRQVDELTDYLMNFFGYEGRVLDNILTPKDRDVFYMLEEIGILGTEMDEVTIKRGKLWRIHYWILRKNNIKNFAAMEVEKDESKEYRIYDRLEDDIWSRDSK